MLCSCIATGIEAVEAMEPGTRTRDLPVVPCIVMTVPSLLYR